MEVKKLFKKDLLDESSPLAAPPAEFIGTLHMPQAAVLHRMLQMEQEQYIVERPSGAVAAWRVLKYNAGRLGAPFGFGKTVVVVALVAKLTPPRRVPFKINLPNLSQREEPFNMDVTTVTQSPPGMDGARRREYPRPEFGSDSIGVDVQMTWAPTLFTGSTLVVVSNSVIAQWEETVKKFAPHLNAFTVNGVEKMRELIDLVSSGLIADYHLVLLKVGSMAAPVGPKKTFSTLEVICKFLPGYVWDRLVIDDFDSINLAARSSIPPAFFTWYVSATDRTSVGSVTNYTSVGIDPAPGPVKSKLMKFFPGFWPAAAGSRDQLIATTLKVNCTKMFRETQFILPAPIHKDYFIRKTGADAMLDHVDLPQEVREALNGGAVHTAAEMMGLHCETSTELVVRILQTNIAACQAATEVLATFEQVKLVLQGRLRLPNMKEATLGATRTLMSAVKGGWRCPPGPEVHTPEEYAAWLRETQGGIPPEVFPPDMSYSSKYDTALETYLDELKGIRDQTGRAVMRLRENAEFGECQVCLLSWADIAAEEGVTSDHRFLTNCCQSLLCCICVTHNHEFVKTCPSCGRPTTVDGESQILSFGPDIDVKTLDLEKALVRRHRPEKPAEGDLIQSIWEEFKKDNKIRALLELVTGAEVTCDGTAEGRPIPGLFGNDNPQDPPPPQEKKKFLIFSYHLESTKRIVKAFEMAGIQSALLRGRQASKEAAISNFRHSKKDREILIITGSKDCAGAHLPEATDVVFFHRMNSHQVEAQLGGRAQRPGRKHSVVMHNFRYR